MAINLEIENTNVTDYLNDSEFFASDGKLYRVYRNNQSQFEIDRYDLENKTIQKLDLEIPDNIVRRINTDYQKKYNFDMGSFYILSNNDLFKFNVLETSISFIESYTLNSNFPIRNFAVRNNVLFGQQAYNFVSKPRVFVYIYDLLKDEELSYNEHLAFHFPQFLHFGNCNNYLDFGDSNYLFAQATSYNIGFFNYNHELVDSIVMNDTKHFPLIKDKLLTRFESSQKVARNPSSYLTQLNDLHSFGGRVWGAQFIKDSLVLVTYSIPQSKNKYVFKEDVWRKTRSGEWKLLTTYDLSYRELEIVTEENFWRSMQFNAKKVIKNNKLYVILFNSTESNFGISQKEMYALNGMTINNIKIYSIQINE